MHRYSAVAKEAGGDKLKLRYTRDAAAIDNEAGCGIAKQICKRVN